MNRMKLKFNAILLLPLIAFLLILNCKKAESPSESNKDDKLSSAEEQIPQFITKSTNIKREGTVNIDVNNVPETNVKLHAIIKDTNSQIIDEKISSDRDGILTIELLCKIPSENFSIFLNKLASVGKLVNIDINSKDLTDQINQKSSEIGYLKNQIKKAEEQEDKTKLNKLKAQLNNKINQKASIKGETIYSYLTIILRQKIGFLDSIISGFDIASSVLKIIIKISIILFIIIIPILLIILSYKYLKQYLKNKFSESKKDNIKKIKK